MSSGATRYFSCQSPRERDEWIRSLRRTLEMTGSSSAAGATSQATGGGGQGRRTDCSLKVSVLEVKGLRDKKRYYVDVLVDDKLYAR